MVGAAPNDGVLNENDVGAGARKPPNDAPKPSNAVGAKTKYIHQSSDHSNVLSELVDLPEVVGAVAPNTPNAEPPKRAAADVVAALKPPKAGAGADVAGVPKPLKSTVWNLSYWTLCDKNICWMIYAPVAPNVLWPNAEGVPNPAAGAGAANACGAPNAGGADVAGVLNVKFP